MHGLELMLSRTCPAVLRETKHNNPAILLFFIGFDELEHYGQRGVPSSFICAGVATEKDPGRTEIYKTNLTPGIFFQPIHP